MRRVAVAVVLIGLTTMSLSSQTVLPRVAPERVNLSGGRLAEATALLEAFVRDGKIAGAVAAVARRGQIGYLQAVGVQDLESRAPMTERTLFRIYSMTKPVTAVAVMMLHEEGRFQLSDPVSKYLPQFREVKVMTSPDAAPRAAAREMTIEDLLLHTSGLSHRTDALYRNAQVRSRAEPMSRFLANLVRTPLMEDPGTRFRYSEATTVLGHLVEIWSGRSFEAFLQQRIFAPLGMTDSIFVVGADRVSRLATVYNPSDVGLRAFEIEAVPVTERPALIEGAVGLVSTVPDYLRFSQMLLNRGELGGVRLLTAETVDRMTRNGLPPAILGGRTSGWGLANVSVVINPESPVVGEYTWDGTAGTIFWIHPANEMITVLMTQSSPANPDGLRQKFKALVQAAVN